MAAWFVLVKHALDLFSKKDDPVKGCDVYKDKEGGSCVHVDGIFCDYPNCTILRKYRECNHANDCTLRDNTPVGVSTLE